MQINVSKFIGGTVGVISLALVFGFGYLAFDLFFGGDTVDVPTLENVNTNLLGPKMQKAAAALINATDKISLKEDKALSFTKSELYKRFVDMPEDVPLSDSRGRPDPFVPYVAP